MKLFSLLFTWIQSSSSTSLLLHEFFFSPPFSMLLPASWFFIEKEMNEKFSYLSSKITKIMRRIHTHAYKSYRNLNMIDKVFNIFFLSLLNFRNKFMKLSVKKRKLVEQGNIYIVFEKNKLK